jgi:hypothetical protein
MTLSPHPSPASERPADDPAAATEAVARGLIARQLAVLGELAETGLTLARAVEREATAAPAPPESLPGSPPESPAARRGGSAAELALAYARVARAVRLTLAQQSRLVAELQGLDEVTVRLRKGLAANAEQDRKAAEARRRGQVARIVGRLIAAEARDEGEGEQLADEAYERLEHDDIYGALADRPMREIVAQVCRDLGLAPDWSRLAEEAWARGDLDPEATAEPPAAGRRIPDASTTFPLAAELRPPPRPQTGRPRTEPAGASP